MWGRHCSASLLERPRLAHFDCWAREESSLGIRGPWGWLGTARAGDAGWAAPPRKPRRSFGHARRTAFAARCSHLAARTSLGSHLAGLAPRSHAAVPSPTPPHSKHTPPTPSPTTNPSHPRHHHRQTPLDTQTTGGATPPAIIRFLPPSLAPNMALKASSAATAARTGRCCGPRVLAVMAPLLLQLLLVG